MSNAVLQRLSAVLRKQAPRDARQDALRQLATADRQEQVRFFCQMLDACAAEKPPKEALALFFAIEDALYVYQGGQAVAYDGGVHAKHRLTAYHDFFVENLRPGERVLDIGCGNGALARDMAERGQVEVTGVDSNADHIGQALSLHPHPRVTYLHGTAPQDLPAERFDVIVMSNVLEHLPERPKFLRLVQDSFGPDRFLIRVPIFERDWRVPLRREIGVEWRLDHTHFTEYEFGQFEREMAEAGLEIVSMQQRWSEIWAVLRKQG